MNTTLNRSIGFALLAVLSTTLAGLRASAQVKLEANVVTTAKHAVTLDKSGLPAQIVIKADPSELPLALRAPGAAPTEPDLQAIGRGPQLRSPIRLQATIGGQTLVAQPAKPVQPIAVDNGVTCQADLQAGALRGTLRVQYASDGSLSAELKYGGQNVDVEKLDLVLELAGRFDTLVAGTPVGVQGTVYPSATAALGLEEGIVWKNVPDAGQPATPNLAGVLTHCFLGSGDRGFTWLTPDATGTAIDPKTPSVVVERDKNGGITWRISLINTPTKAKDVRTITFAVLVHPSRTKPAARRMEQWKPWKEAPALPAMTWAARKPGLDIVRADAATVHEAQAARALLEGPAGGDAASTTGTLADAFPPALFRYLAAPHTGLSVQLRTNAGQLATPGMTPACDRMALGRALLHDIGIDATTLGQRAGVARVVQALTDFGYFNDDGKTEFLPYWRTSQIVRYGETFSKGGSFEVTESDPMARVFVSVFLRPCAKDPAKTQSLILVVNEGDRPTREQLYVLQPQRLFGGANQVTAYSVIRDWDCSRIPKDSDWRTEVLIGSAQDRKLPPLHLRDLEDNGFVRAASTEGGMEIYGLLHVPARSFRLLYGAGAL